MIKKIILGLAVVLLPTLIGVASYRAGVAEGIDKYHSQCFNMGGYIIDDTGRVVQCAPLTIIPRQELPALRDQT